MTASVQPTSGFADAQGARLFYEVAGRGSALVLLHARLADSRMWDDNWPALAEQATVIRYDLRGHGRSAMPAGEFSHVADLAGLLAFLNIDRACLVGSSMGGEIAIDFALQHPENVTALVPVACAPGGYAWSPDLEQKWGAIFTALERGDFAGAVELELQMWVDGPQRTPDQVFASVRERVREMDMANWLALAEYRHRARPAPPLDPPASARLGEITAPTLVVVGDADVRDILAAADLLTTAIPAADKVVVHGAGHMLPMEQPRRFNQIIQHFLSSQGI